MLGRLKMSIKECIAAYGDLAGTIFDTMHLTTDGSYDAKYLKDAVAEMARKYLQDENAPMTSPEADKCKVYGL